jgi:hypothetical protein
LNKENKMRKETRRNFLKIGASLAIASSASSANAKINFKRKSPGDRDLLKVGLLLGEGGHSTGIWGKYFNPPEGQIRRLGMLFTKVWSANPEVVEKFGKKYNIERVNKFDEMIDMVDGIMIDDFYAVAYNHILARPYLEAGMPTFINRPFTDSIKKAKEMTDLAKKNNAPLLTGSSYEHIKEIYTIRAMVKKEEITGYDAWNNCSDYYSHGIHGILGAYAATGGGIEAVSLTCNDLQNSRGGVTTLSYKDRGKGQFTGRITEGQMPNSGENWFGITVYPSKKTQVFNHMDEWGIDEFMWLPMLHRIQWMFETGGLYQSYEEIVEKSSLFTGAFYSNLERDGKMVSLAEIPEDWAIGSPYGFNETSSQIDIYEKLFGKETGRLKPK